MKLSTPKLTTLYPGASLAFWDGAHSVCGVCFPLNKSTSYLSTCLSLNSFCDETWRTWASLSPETRVWSQLKDCGFKSQPGFCLDSSPGLWVQVPIWVTQFHFLMKQLKEVLHQNESINQERKKYRLWESQEIITREVVEWWSREIQDGGCAGGLGSNQSRFQPLLQEDEASKNT